MTNEDINAIYNAFDEKGQDMPRAAFHAQMRHLTDPKLMANEAHDIAVGNINRKKINQTKGTKR